MDITGVWNVNFKVQCTQDYAEEEKILNCLTNIMDRKLICKQICNKITKSSCYALIKRKITPQSTLQIYFFVFESLFIICQTNTSASKK